MTQAPPKEDLVTVTIDGIEASVPKGTLLIRVAEQLGISVSTLYAYVDGKGQAKPRARKLLGAAGR